VIERINEARIHAIGTLVSQLHDLLEEYGNPSYLCTNSQFSFECGCMLYGALYKEMRLGKCGSSDLPSGVILEG
jgi:hypothetical protein